MNTFNPTPCPFNPVRLPLQDLDTFGITPAPELVAYYATTEINAVPVVVEQLPGHEWQIIQGRETVAAMRAAGLVWVWALQVEPAAFLAERQLLG